MFRPLLHSNNTRPELLRAARPAAYAAQKTAITATATTPAYTLQCHLACLRSSNSRKVYLPLYCSFATVRQYILLTLNSTNSALIVHSLNEHT